MNKIEKAILQTLAFFGLFERPLELDELVSFLYRTKASRLQVLLETQKLIQKKLLVKKDQYFALKSDAKIMAEFLGRAEINRKRWRKARRFIKILGHLPFVKGIFVINSLAFGTTDKESDIDIMLVAAKNHLWTARALMVGALEMMGQNKNRWYKAGKFCLGLGIAEDNLNLDTLRLQDDIYFTYWLATLKPIFDRKIYEKFITANAWIFEELPNWTPYRFPTDEEKKSRIEKLVIGPVGKVTERFLSRLQIRRIWNEEENYRPGASVVATEKIMKLHAHDRRQEYRDLWQKKCSNLDPHDQLSLNNW